MINFLKLVSAVIIPTREKYHSGTGGLKNHK